MLGNIKNAVLLEIKNYFKPEFINRIDDIVVFHSLNQDQIKQIVKIQINHLINRLSKLELNLIINDNVIDHLATIGFDPVYGARPIKRAIVQELENNLANKILSTDHKLGSKVFIDYNAATSEMMIDFRSDNE